jgi:hypothetical protein
LKQATGKTCRATEEQALFRRTYLPQEQPQLTLSPSFFMASAARLE